MTDFQQTRAAADACNHCMKSIPRVLLLFSGQPVGPPIPIAREDEELVALLIANVAQSRRRATTYEKTIRMAHRISALFNLLDLLPADTHGVYLAQTDPSALAPALRQVHDTIRRQFAVEFPEQSAELPYHPE
jgi:hypothetical protein